jgi:hypothetical protein
VETIKVYTRAHLEQLGLMEQETPVEIDIEALSEVLYLKISQNTGSEQVDLAKQVYAEGWNMEDFEMCLKLLKRKNKIAYFV